MHTYIRVVLINLEAEPDPTPIDAEQGVVRPAGRQQNQRVV